ncbi:MAG: metallopeptidase TldD-related protein [Polyangiaceae bacterium]
MSSPSSTIRSSRAPLARAPTTAKASQAARTSSSRAACSARSSASSLSARKLGRESTASASRGSSAGVGPSTSNFILQPGRDSAESIVKGTKRGLFVTDMMGYGYNPVTGDFSRGASGFWIENGELTFPVSEVTISLNVDDLWQRLDAVGSDLDLRTSTASPTIRVGKMTIAGGAAE